MKNKPNFSCVLICRNEEKTLSRMLASLKEFKDAGGDIVICDTGSTDKTAQIARDFGCSTVVEVGDRFRITVDEDTANKVNQMFVVDDEEPILKFGDTLFDFSSARNYAASLAVNDMISMQDADEVYTVLNFEKISELVDQGIGQFEYLFIFSHLPDGRPSVQFTQSKMYDRKKLEWTGLVHEVLCNIKPEEIKRYYLPDTIFKLEHYQNVETPRGQYLAGLALDCFLDPEKDRSLHYFAREVIWSGRPKSAIKAFEKHISMKRWRTEEAQSMIYIGDAYAQLNEGDKQIEWYHKAFIHDSSRREALIKLAYFFKHHNEPQKVLSYIAAALQIPWHGFYANRQEHYENEPHELMYWAKGWTGDVAGAQQHILKALEYQPYNPKYLQDTKYYFEYSDKGIEGWMRFPELQWLYNNAKNMDSIIEIGSWKGRSTHALCSGCKNGEVTAVDHFLGSNEPQHEGAAKDDAIFKAFLENTKEFDNLLIERSGSIEVSEKYNDKAFDMVFLDASHDYDSVKADIRAWKSKAKIMLCGHDFCNEWPGVRKAVIEELGAVQVCDSIWYKYVCDFPKVSIVIPTLGREEKLQRLINKIKENAGYTNYEIIVESDSFENRQGAPKTLKRGIEKSTGDFVMFLGNDCIPEKDFLLIAMLRMIKAYPEMDGLVALNDGYWVGGEFGTHWLASKKLLPYLEGEFFHTGYHHTGCDNELTERCRLIGKYVWEERAKVYHDHPVQKGFKHEDMDDIYRIAYDTKNMDEDKALLYERAAKYGFSVKHSFTSPRKYPDIKDPRIDLRKRIKNYTDMKVLNVGVGTGESALAAQLPFFRFKQLDHVDLYKPYLDNAKNIIWDAQQVNYLNTDIKDIDMSEYDLVLMFDVVEHLPKQAAIEVLKNAKNCIAFIPIEKEFRKNPDGILYQEHLSLWTEQDITDRPLGYEVEVLENFHGDFSAMFATKKEVTQCKKSTSSIKANKVFPQTKIPRIIYTIWLNDSSELPELVIKCFESQKKILSNYEHRLITLDNCYRTYKYVRDALGAKNWVKASDFLRMQYLYETGGIYLDADCEVLKDIDDLLNDRMFVCQEPFGTYANGIVGVEPYHPLIKQYLNRIIDNFHGYGDLVFEPGIRAFTDLIYASNKEELGIKIYSSDYFFPYNHGTGETKITENTRIFHHYMKSWVQK